MDTQELVSVHTYITQVAEKFDLRTTMLVREFSLLCQAMLAQCLPELNMPLFFPVCV